MINIKRSYGDIPLVVLSATESTPPPGASDAAKARHAAFFASFEHAHDAVAALSSRGANRPVPGTSQYIYLLKLQGMIDAVDEVVDQARAPAKPCR